MQNAKILRMLKQVLLLLFVVNFCSAQVVSISPAEEFRGQTVNVVIKLQPGVIQAANPPADSFDVYIMQGSARINSDAFTPAQIYPGTQPYDDSLHAAFSIPSTAVPGWYTVHVTTYTSGMVPVDNVLANGFLVRLPGSCSVPTGVDDSAVTATSAKIFWSPSVTADTFRVRYREIGTTNNFYKDINGAGGVDSTILNGLNPGATYLLDISTICSGIHSTYSLPLDTFTTSAQTANCAIPYSITFSAVTNTSVNISWNNNIVSDTFRIKYKITGSPSLLYKNVNGSLHSTTLSNLLPGTSYDIQISSVCNGAGTGYSIVKTLTTASTAANCITPFGVSSSAITNTSALISWSNLITADTFRIRYNITGSSVFLYKDVAGSAFSATLNGLQPGTGYQYRVSSKCSGNGTGYSSQLSFTTTSTPSNCSTIPFGLNASNITNASATVTWTPLVTADSFLVRYSVNGTTNYKWKMVSGSAGNTTTLTGLSPTTTYQWQVRTKCNAAPATAYSASDIFTTPVRLAAPGALDGIVKVYPNPTSANLLIELNSEEECIARMNLVDMSGRIVYEKSIPVIRGFNSIELVMTDFASGIYQLNFSAGDINFNKRVVKQ
jgi:hypothetical protein